MQQCSPNPIGLRFNRVVVLRLCFLYVNFRTAIHASAVALLAAMLMASPQLVQAQCTFTQSGLMALYPNNGSPADRAGYNYGFNNATLVNSPIYVGDNTFGAVLQLSGGNNQYMQLPNGLLQDSSAFSISIWFQTTSNGVLLGAQSAPPFGSSFGASNSWDSLIYVGADGRLTVAMASTGFNPAGVASATAVNDGHWHHVVFTVSSSPANYFGYLDGAYFGSANTNLWSLYSYNMPYNQIGAGYTLNYPNTNPGWFPFSGLIGEVAIYNKVLAQSDVTNLFNAGPNGVCTPTADTITANNDSISPGAPFSPLSLTFNPGITPNWAPIPTCYSSANGASQPFPAFYENAINCYGGAGFGYALVYQGGTLSLGNPPPVAGTDPVVEPDGYVAQPYQQSVTIAGAPNGSTYSTSGTLPPGVAIVPSTGVLAGIPTKAGDYSFTATWSLGAASGSQPVRLKVLPGFGDLIVSTYSTSGNVTGNVYRVNPNTGDQTQLAGFGGFAIVDVAVDPATGTTYALATSGTVYAITTSGNLSTFYSNPSLGPTYAIAVDNSSNVYFASVTQIYKLNSSGVLVSVTGQPNGGTPMMANPVAGNNSPRMIFDRDGNLLVAGDVSGVPKVSSTVLTSQLFTTYVYTATGAGNIQGMTFARDGSGDLILADVTNNSLIRISQLHAANIVTTIMTSQNAFNGSLVGVVAGNTVPFNEYYVGEGTGFGTFKVVPQTSNTFSIANYPEPHQSAITWFRFGQTAITIATPGVTGFTAGTAYNFALQAIGGTGSYTWSQTGFPSGLNLTTGGTVTGTPTSAGSYPVTIQVTDSAGNVGIGQYTFTVSSSTLLTIIASNQSITYGGTLPTPTFTTNPPGVQLASPPTCSYGVLPSPLNVGSYQGVINCIGGSALGYTISYASGSLTVNPAPLTVTANSFVTPYNAALPTLTANITGFVNNDTVSTATTGAPALSVNVPAGNPAGTYAISAAQGTLAANNYTFSNFVPGTLTISAVPQTPTLNLMNNFVTTGDFVARSIDLPFTASATPGYLSTTITIPNQNQAADGVPNGAEVVGAWLYWQDLENASTYPSTAPGSLYGMFNGYNIYGTPIATDLTTGCWTSSAPGYVLRTYRSEVTAFLPVDANTGSYTTVGPQTVALPQLGSNGYGYGASLVVIYRLMSPNTPLKATAIYDGNWSQEYPPGYTPNFNLNLTGFYDSNSQVGPARFADITGLVNTNGTFSFLPAISQTTTLQIPDASASVAMPNNFAGLQSGQCRLWSATVVSTPVHASDNDGLIDSWKLSHGYTDVLTGTWVDLTGAQPGQRDLFVQYDYMTAADHSHVPSANALSIVQKSLAAHGITPHFIAGNPIPEDTCTTDNTSATPPQYCVFPNEPGVVMWKVGLEDLKTTVVDAAACQANPVPSNAACQPRFPLGRRNSYHYALFGHSLGIANWSIHDGTLLNISVGSNNQATVNINPATPFKTCPSRVTITNAMVTLELNGTYTVNSCNATNTSFTITTVNVPANTTYPSASNPAETALAIINGTTSSISGYSDVGGSDSVITLGKWGANGTRDNVVAGTFMHELGHTLGLSHGGVYSAGGGTPFYEPNCKPNYQSVMNYLFQIDGLGSNGVVDYSSEVLASLPKPGLGPQPAVSGVTTQSNGTPLYSTTSWYAPIPPNLGASPATRQCDGRVPPDGVYGYLVSGASNPVAWLQGQDVNFDGSNTDTLDGYNDWAAVDFRQVGVTGREVLFYPIGLADGGIQLSGGGGIQLSGGGGIQRTGGGGIQLSGGGGIQRSGSGGIQLAGGGGIQLSGGGGIQRTGGGGIQLSGGGGIQLAGGGGIQRTGGGGITAASDAELFFETANAVVHPPRAVTTNGNVVNWTAASFGNVTSYNVYRSTNGGAPVLIASVPSVAGQTNYTYTDNTVVAGNTYAYTVTTVVTDTDPSTGVTTTRQSTAPNPPTTQQNQTVNFPNPGPLYFTTQPIPLQAVATSGMPITYAPSPSSLCSMSGPAALQLKAPIASPSSTCTVVATQAGSSFYKMASATDNIVILPWTITGFYPPVNMSSGGAIVWNVIKGGQTVPLKFNVAAGTAQFSATSVVVGQAVSISTTACSAGTTTTDTLLTNTGSTSLTWDGSQFIQNWKTPSGSGQCYTATVKTLDGSSIIAYFRTK